MLESSTNCNKLMYIVVDVSLYPYNAYTCIACVCFSFLIVWRHTNVQMIDSFALLIRFAFEMWFPWIIISYFGLAFGRTLLLFFLVPVFSISITQSQHTLSSKFYPFCSCNLRFCRFFSICFSCITRSSYF